MSGAFEGRRVAGYARVSTARQAEEGQSLDAQDWAIRDFAERRSWTVVQIWSDVMSGARDDRPNLRLMLDEAERHEFSALIVSRLDRLGRSMRHNLKIYERLEACGVELFALDMPLDVATAAGHFSRGMLTLMAEYERSLLRERTLDGIAELATRRTSEPG